ncbi:hypothetical protein Tco_0690028 [Tanacetum coccineum]
MAAGASASGEVPCHLSKKQFPDLELLSSQWLATHGDVWGGPFGDALIEKKTINQNPRGLQVWMNLPAIRVVKASQYGKALALADEDFTCWRLAAEEVVAEDVVSTNTPTSPDENIKKSRRVLIKPGVATPSKPTEERGKKVQVDLDDSDEEATCDLDDDEADVEGQSGSATKKKKRYIVDESASE